MTRADMSRKLVRLHGRVRAAVQALLARVRELAARLDERVRRAFRRPKG